MIRRILFCLSVLVSALSFVVLVLESPNLTSDTKIFIFNTYPREGEAFSSLAAPLTWNGFQVTILLGLCTVVQLVWAIFCYRRPKANLVQKTLSFSMSLILGKLSFARLIYSAWHHGDPLGRDYILFRTRLYTGVVEPTIETKHQILTRLWRDIIPPEQEHLYPTPLWSNLSDVVSGLVSQHQFRKAVHDHFIQVKEDVQRILLEGNLLSSSAAVAEQKSFLSRAGSSIYYWFWGAPKTDDQVQLILEHVDMCLMMAVVGYGSVLASWIGIAWYIKWVGERRLRFIGESWDDLEEKESQRCTPDDPPQEIKPGVAEEISSDSATQGLLSKVTGYVRDFFEGWW